MNLDSRDKKYPLISSFKFAFAGIKKAIFEERNMRIHLSISILVIFAGVWFSISAIEWILILFAIGGMLALEMLNSAIERVVDLAAKEIHPLAKAAKDMAAGAVLIYAIMSVIIGLIIFLPKIF
jgi:undecaprenol kinase